MGNGVYRMMRIFRKNFYLAGGLEAGGVVPKVPCKQKPAPRITFSLAAFLTVLQKKLTF